MKINLIGGLFRLWVFVFVIWFVGSWVIFGDIINNRYPTGSNFFVDLEVATPASPAPREIITESFKFREIEKNPLRGLVEPESEDDYIMLAVRRNLIQTVEYSNNNTLIIRATVASQFGGVSVNEFGDVFVDQFGGELVDPPFIEVDLETLNYINLSETFSSYLKELRQESFFPALLKFSKVAVLPPMLLFVLGIFLIWVIQGFKPKTKK